MSQFSEKFIQESQDMLTDLESDLIELEKDLSNEEYLNNIFRYLHTIKGGALMIGLDHLGSFIHEIEAIFALLRDGAKKIDDQILSLSFQAVDHIKKVLKDPNLTDHFLKENQQNLIAVLKQLQNQDQNLENIVPKMNYVYGMTIKPISPLKTDTEHPIIFVIKELKSTYENYFLKRIAHEEEILFWFIIVDQVSEKDELEALFLFVEDDFEISIQELGSSEDFHLSEQMKTKLNEQIQDKKELPSLEDTKKIFANLSEQVSKNKPEVASQDNSTAINENKANERTGSTRISKYKVNRLINAVSELMTLNSSLKNIASTHSLNDLNLITEKIELEINHLREDVFSLNLRPLSTLNTQFKRMVRNLSKQQGKKVEFEMVGGDTELDKHMIESLENPLLHILRNSIDHGIEPSEERLKKEKKETGLITLSGYYTGTDVIIEIKDDGRGINADKVRAKAIERGIIEQSEVMSDEELYHLICYPGFSTADELTELSGRGVGMDVVKKNIDSLKGNLHISSTPQKGTHFTIRLPLTLSIIDGLLVDVENVKYIVPMFSIDQIYRLPTKSIEREDYFSFLVQVDGQQISVLNLRKEFQFNQQENIDIKEMDVIMLSNNEKSQGIAVDKIYGEIQAIIKPIGKHFSTQKYILGSSILGDGSLALVLDTHRLIHQFHSNN
ncbi:chemotaxis protein CheA [Microscilla marina]|uniref:histidine kinase n=1 Tax=Microscilla marina ATCC 23134 TaxID=313606 RepID=A1ZV35_MICM2|nr:chemotaxis protein CheW [Microscilla marina]EAY25691.1 chemotaxis protein CheA [Microscilla marina ATCC 23134]